MQYLRWLEQLPSGEFSSSYIVGSDSGLMNMDNGKFIKYEELNQLFGSATEDEMKDTIGERLLIKGEELDVLCQKLFVELDKSQNSNYENVA